MNGFRMGPKGDPLTHVSTFLAAAFVRYMQKIPQALRQVAGAWRWELLFVLLISKPSRCLRALDKSDDAMVQCTTKMFD